MNPLVDFIRFGIVGELRLGMQRSDVVRRLGRPKTWLGKPPCFGPAVPTPEEAEVWGYYDAAGIRFDQHGLAVGVSVVPKHIHKDREPFNCWPIGPELDMGECRDLLKQSAISYDLDEDGSGARGSFYILAERRCVVTVIPFDKGALVPLPKRKVLMMETVINDEALPPFVLRYWRHEGGPFTGVQ